MPAVLWQGWKRTSILNQTHRKPLGLPSHTPCQTEPQEMMQNLGPGYTFNMTYLFRGITFSMTFLCAQTQQYLEVYESQCSELQPSMITHFYWTFCDCFQQILSFIKYDLYLCPLWNETLLQRFHAFYASKRYLHFIKYKLHASDFWGPILFLLLMLHQSLKPNRHFYTETGLQHLWSWWLWWLSWSQLIINTKFYCYNTSEITVKLYGGEREKKYICIWLIKYGNFLKE